MIEIMNLRKTKPSEPYDFYIDRRSPVGNPFPMKGESTRDQACEDYEKWFENLALDSRVNTYLEKMKASYAEHGSLRLFCWCAPKRCHGETIKSWIEESTQFHKGEDHDGAG